MKYLDLLVDLGIDLIAVFVVAVVLYYRRHRRADLLMAFVSVNVGLFITMSLLSSVRVDLSTGFGLFAILSIIQLRSKPASQEEVAYYFAVLVMGLANGLRLHDRLMTIILNLVLIGVLYLVDNRALFNKAYRITVTLDVVHEDPSALVADLERRLRGQVMDHIVEDVDYVREITVIDVRYRPDNPVRPNVRRDPPSSVNGMEPTWNDEFHKPTIAR
jgi:hypothetical protein